MVPRRDFISQVLVPETTILLIGQDMDQDPKECLSTLKKSRKYGALQFPCGDSDSDSEDGDYRRRMRRAAKGKKKGGDYLPVLPNIKKEPKNYESLPFTIPEESGATYVLSDSSSDSSVLSS